MLIQAILGPIATVWILPPVATLSCLLISGCIGGLSLGLRYVRAHIIGVPEINISTFSTVMLGMSICLLLYINLVKRWEDNFDSLPWKQQHTARQKLTCPFTGDASTMRCPCCEAFVSEAAFHKRDALATFLFGDSVLGWDKAHKGLKLGSEPAKGRMMLDEGLDLRGNFYFSAVTACCIGCAAWHRIFNLLPRMVLTMVCVSLVGTYTPWAFGQSLANLNSWGGKLQALAEAVGLFFATSALHMQLHAMASAVSFMTRHASKINFPSPIVAPRQHWLGVLIDIVAGQAAER